MAPSNELLDKSTLHASNDPVAAAQCLLRCGFDYHAVRGLTKQNQLNTSLSSSRMRTSLKNFMRESSSSSNTEGFFGAHRVSSKVREKPVSHWMVDKENPQSDDFTIFEIPNSQLNSEGSIEKRRIKKIKAKEGKMGGSNAELHTTADGYRTTPSHSNASEGRSWAQPSSENQLSSGESLPVPISQSYYKAPSTPEPQKMELKYRHYPSNIIPEMSEEYRGSHRDSIVNIEPDMGYKALRVMTSNLNQPESSSTLRSSQGRFTRKQTPASHNLSSSIR